MEEGINFDTVNPPHYKQGGKEVVEMMEDIWGIEGMLIFCEMNAFKYRMRMGRKPNAAIHSELNKAMWYEERAKDYRKQIDNAKTDNS